MNTPDILFQYLKDILYNPEDACLDIDRLPEDFQKLGQGMELLGKWMRETKNISLSIARGELSYDSADKENMFAAPIKELQSALRHLTWQTQQVAKGDYSQRVDFMGEFSEKFNSMVEQLRERKEALIMEKQLMEEKNKELEEKNRELEQTFELVMSFANYTRNMIFINSAETGENLFQNEFAMLFTQSRPGMGKIIREKLNFHILEQEGKSGTWTFEFFSVTEGKWNYFQVESYPSVWKHRNAVVHIVTDNTEWKNKEIRLQHLVYTDSLTGVYNQRYAMEQMKKWICQKTAFVLSFIDVDFLKYYNDTWGHKAGDAYLHEIAEALGSLEGILCRTGGDEFMLLTTGTTGSEQDSRLEGVRRKVQESGRKQGLIKSFSFASCDVPEKPDKRLEEYIIEADSRMYRYKERYKESMKHLTYKDNRQPDMSIENPQKQD